VLARRRPILIGCAALAVGAGVLALQLQNNDQFVQYFDRSVAFRRDVDFTMKNLSGIYRLEYQVGSNAPSGVADPAYLHHLDDFGAWLRAQPEVDHVYSLVEILKTVNRAVRGDTPAAYQIPDSGEEASQDLLLYEMSLPAGLDLTDRVNVDKSSARLTVTVRDMSTAQMNAFVHRSRAWMEDHLPPPMWADATGPVVIFSELGDRNARAMLKGDLASLALISLCMILVLRSFKLGLLSVVPNVLPIVIGYGVWRLAVGQLNIVATVAGSISLGIIVDDTIHFLTKYQALQRKGNRTPAQTMSETLAHVGPAMLGTSIILVLGFGVLTLSSFQMTSYLGWLSVLIIGIAPLADLLVAPALVVSLTRNATVPRRAHIPARDLHELQAGVS
jgi:predicted RND superfamily exporter protein